MSSITDIKRLIVREGGFHHVYCVGPVHPVVHMSVADFQMIERMLETPTRNMTLKEITHPVWPLKFGVSASLKDTISPQAKQWQSQVPYRVLFRLWTTTKARSIALKHAAYHILGSDPKMLNAAYIDGTDEFDQDMLNLELRCWANQKRFRCYDDVEFDDLLETMMRRMYEQNISQPSELFAA